MVTNGNLSLIKLWFFEEMVMLALSLLDGLGLFYYHLKSVCFPTYFTVPLVPPLAPPEVGIFVPNSLKIDPLF
jgi:hypothetical protein